MDRIEESVANLETLDEEIVEDSLDLLLLHD